MMTAEQLQEEVFCLKFELNALSDLLVRREAERWVPGFLYPGIEKEHLARYELVKSYVENKKVLDLACGSGYGSYILATDGKAKQVDGGDINDLSLRYARHRFVHDGLNYFHANAEQYCKENFYDIVVSFETVEHLNKPELLLENISKSLVSGGLLFISTPLTIATNKKPFNPYHTIEWSFDDFQQLIKNYFKIEEVYIQNVSTKKIASHLPARVFRKMQSVLGYTNEEQEDYRLIPYTKDWQGRPFYKGYQLLICSKK